MTARLIYQPCSDPVARKNLQTTILNPVRLKEIADLLEPPLLAELKLAYPDGKLFIWGLSSPNTRNAWQAMQPGDTVIFNTQTVITVSACFSHATKNRNLALKLWGWANEAIERTWENIYFVTDVRHHAISYEAIQTLTNIRQKQSFYRYNVDQSSTVFEQYPELDRSYTAENITLSEVRKSIERQETDGLAIRPTRLEHKYIVRHLFQNKPSGYCCICLNEYPRHLLVAAHIKKRSVCNIEEKLDIENIAVSMCRLGCDPLFEHGYIGVKAGKVVKHPSRDMRGPIAIYVDSLLDNQVRDWTIGKRKYFAWHLNAHGFEPGALADAD